MWKLWDLPSIIYEALRITVSSTLHECSSFPLRFFDIASTLYTSSPWPVHPEFSTVMCLPWKHIECLAQSNVTVLSFFQLKWTLRVGLLIVLPTAPHISKSPKVLRIAWLLLTATTFLYTHSFHSQSGRRTFLPIQKAIASCQPITWKPWGSYGIMNEPFGCELDHYDGKVNVTVWHRYTHEQVWTNFSDKIQFFLGV
jgi:hypothetical protein